MKTAASLIQIDTTHAQAHLSAETIRQAEQDALAAIETLHTGSGAGNDFLGWLTLPEEMLERDLCKRVQTVADRLRHECLYIICIGIGGSYLGGKAVMEALGDHFSAHRQPELGRPQVLFAGNNISSDYLHDLMDLVVDKPFGIVNISKSGTTTEPAIAFRMLSQYLVARDGQEVAKRRIVAITDKKRGALRRLADEQGYDTFVIPDDVGGRFSVLTPVGLLPIALAGFDIEALLQGASDTALLYRSTEHPLETPAVQYAVTRQAAYRERAVSEVLVAFEPRLSAMGQWWMQLFGESEGKEGKGLLPLSLTYTTDLHSMGQWIQQGPHNILETMIVVDTPRDTITIPTDEQNLDGLNYLAGETMHYVNEQAHLGTLLAHEDGGVPVLQLQLPQIDARTIGAFIYTMEYAVAVSGYMMGINPFDQPGVEDYKRNMFALLAKPGFESETKAMRQRLNK